MSHAFSFKSGLLTLSLGFAAAFAVLTPVHEAQAGDDVVCKDLKFGPLKTMCDKAKGKPKEVRNVMKAAQNAYNDKDEDKGNDIKCLTCHEKGNGGALKEGESKKYWDEFSKKLETAANAWVPTEKK